MTAFDFIGPDGLRARGAFSKRAEKWFEDNSATVLEKVAEYSKWREQVNVLVQRRRQS